MPMLNPGLVVLSSPMLVDTFAVRRRAVEVLGNGRGKTTDSVVRGIRGVVCATGNNGQKRSEDSAIGFTTYTVITKYPLRKQAEGIEPDLVLWKGRQLQVIDLADYTPYGTGWVEATCTSQTIPDPRTGSDAAI